MLNEQELNQFIKDALQEDVRGGDHTSLASLDKNAIGKAHAQSLFGRCLPRK